MHEKLNEILQKTVSGDISCLNPDNVIFVSKCASELLAKGTLDQYDQMCACIIISISQIVYNNTDRSVLFLDDGVYDLLLEMYREYDKNFQVGAPVISFDQVDIAPSSGSFIEGMSFLENVESFTSNSLYFEDLTRNPGIDIRLLDNKIDRSAPINAQKRNVVVPHKYPKLVGSLDKCKFALDKEALDRGVYDEPNVKIFERDFLAKHLAMGIIDKTTPFELIAELKYDGVSIEADVTHKILSARSRGDANADIAADLSDIFKDYRFPYAVDLDESEAFGIKFEAIINSMNLDKLAYLKGKYYKNSRNGIIGLLGSSDAYNYRDLITLVPLSTSMEDLDRVNEIEFLNKYYNSGEYLRYSVLSGTYVEILYQVYKFVKEAEALRNMLPFMYDGVVISYRDPNIIKALGRENSINKYSVAIKFNPLIREAVFTGYSFTVGQDGTITPIAYYTPVEFYGTIHTKSSAHSYSRFMELDLAIGDVISVEYTNDVMPYISNISSTLSNTNPNPKEKFITNCPFCSTPIVFRQSMKSAYCPNKDCPERVVARLSNMMAKLNLKDFGEETFRVLKTSSLSDLLDYTYSDVKNLGTINGEKLLNRIDELKTTSMPDYKLIGAIGFTGIAIETWRKILSQISLMDIISNDDTTLFNKLSAIKGIGNSTATTIVEERYYFNKDLVKILSLPNIILSYNTIATEYTKIIRYSGCRPSDKLTEYLTSKGCDARPDAGVTKATDILVVPYLGFSSSKTSKLRDDAVIIDIASFENSADSFL